MTIDLTQVNLTLEQKRRVAEYAARIGMPWNVVLEAALARMSDDLSVSNDRAEQTERTAFDAFTDAGLIGLEQDGPPDLATNPKYMEGFGTNAADSCS